MKSELNIQQKQIIECRIASEIESSLVKSEKSTLENFAGIAISEISDSTILQAHSGEISIVENLGTAYIALGEGVHLSNELERLRDERNKLSKYILSLNTRLSNQSFVDKAPEEVVEKEKERLNRSTDREARINEILETLN